MIRQLCYISKANGQFEKSDLMELLAKARAANSVKDVTGFLVFDGDHFFQLLEGEDSAVEFIFEKIKNDPRHSNITLLMDSAAQDRLLADWSMQFFLPADFELEDRLSILDVLAVKHERDSLSGILQGLRFPKVGAL